MPLVGILLTGIACSAEVEIEPEEQPTQTYDDGQRGIKKSMITRSIKSFVVTLCILFSIVMLVACEPRFYVGDNIEHQVLIRKNASTLSFWQGQSHTLGKDQYGRELFTYSSDGNEALVISQAVDMDNQYLWYYEDLCVVMHQGEAGFTDTEVNTLKETNDWNKPLDMVKMTKRSFTDSNDNYNIRYAKELIKASLSDLLLKDENAYINVYAIDRDMQGKRLYFVKLDRTNSIPEGFGLYFFMTDEDGYNYLIGYERMDDAYNYTQQLHEFKVRNGWTFQ